jgi:hypothetical protein
MQVMLVHIVGVVPEPHRRPDVLANFDLHRDRIGVGAWRLAAAVADADTGCDFIDDFSRGGNHP